MGKRSAQARNEVETGGVRDQSRMATTQHEAWGNAREPDGDNAGTPRLFSNPRGKNIARFRCDAWPTCPFTRESPLEGKHSAQCAPCAKGEEKKGQSPRIT